MKRLKQGHDVVLFAVILAILLVIMVACAPGPQAITDATLRDQIFSIEPRVNGTTTIWMVHDDVGSYCTKDPAVVKAAWAIFASADPTAIIEYRSLNGNDSASGGVLGELDPGACAQESSGSSSNHTTYLIISIKPLRDYQASVGS